MRRAMPLFDRASLIHTDPCDGHLCLCRCHPSVPAWPAFAVVTRTSIGLRLAGHPHPSPAVAGPACESTRAARLRPRGQGVSHLLRGPSRASSTRARATPESGSLVFIALERKASCPTNPLPSSPTLGRPSTAAFASPRASCPPNVAMDFLPQHFGERAMIKFEMSVYDWMGSLCPTYRGGFWNYVELSQRRCFHVPLGRRELRNQRRRQRLQQHRWCRGRRHHRHPPSRSTTCSGEAGTA